MSDIATDGPPYTCPGWKKGDKIYYIIDFKKNQIFNLTM